MSEAMPQNRIPLTYILIAANVAISVLAFASRDVFAALFFQVGPIMNGQVHRLLTSGFLHADIMHLLFNMVSLFFFGPVLEDKRALGKRGFLIVYFVALLAGNLWALGTHLNEPYYSAVGASGAVSGVLLGVALFAPFMTILIFGFIPIPAILFALLFVAFSAFAPVWDTSNIGHEAHLGGAVAGLIMTVILRPEVLKHTLREVGSIFRR